MYKKDTPKTIEGFMQHHKARALNDKTNRTIGSAIDEVEESINDGDYDDAITLCNWILHRIDARFDELNDEDENDDEEEVVIVDNEKFIEKRERYVLHFLTVKTREQLIKADCARFREKEINNFNKKSKRGKFSKLGAEQKEKLSRDIYKKYLNRRKENFRMTRNKTEEIAIYREEVGAIIPDIAECCLLYTDLNSNDRSFFNGEGKSESSYVFKRYHAGVVSSFIGAILQDVAKYKEGNPSFEILANAILNMRFDRREDLDQAQRSIYETILFFKSPLCVNHPAWNNNDFNYGIYCIRQLHDLDIREGKRILEMLRKALKNSMNPKTLAEREKILNNHIKVMQHISEYKNTFDNALRSNRAFQKEFIGLWGNKETSGYIEASTGKFLKEVKKVKTELASYKRKKKLFVSPPPSSRGRKKKSNGEETPKRKRGRPRKVIAKPPKPAKRGLKRTRKDMEEQSGARKVNVPEKRRMVTSGFSNQKRTQNLIAEITRLKRECESEKRTLKNLRDSLEYCKYPVNHTDLPTIPPLGNKCTQLDLLQHRQEWGDRLVRLKSKVEEVSGQLRFATEKLRNELDLMLGVKKRLNSQQSANTNLNRSRYFSSYNRPLNQNNLNRRNSVPSTAQSLLNMPAPPPPPPSKDKTPGSDDTPKIM